MIAGSAAVELPVDFVSGAIWGLIPGDGETEALDDTLALLEETLELLPGLGCGTTSWLCWKFVTTGECSLEPCDEFGRDGTKSAEEVAISEADLLTERSDVGLLTAGVSVALLSADFTPPLTMSLMPPTEVLNRL